MVGATGDSASAFLMRLNLGLFESEGEMGEILFYKMKSALESQSEEAGK